MSAAHDVNRSRERRAEFHRPLADRLRSTLRAARGNSAIRHHLRGVVEDPEQLDPIVDELGAQHALVRELLEITGTPPDRTEADLDG